MSFPATLAARRAPVRGDAEVAVPDRPHRSARTSSRASPTVFRQDGGICGEAITGSPLAIASITGTQNPSCADGITKTSALR